MKLNLLLVLLAAFSVAVFGCTQAEIDAMEKDDVMEKNGEAMEKESEVMTKEADVMEKSDEVMEKSEQTIMEKPIYTGNVLAGTEATK